MTGTEPSIHPNHLLVEVPWPNRALSPNNNVHRMVQARARKHARDAAYLLTTQAIRMRSVDSPMPNLFRGVDVIMVFRPKANRGRDEDNAIASMKGYLDGVALALNIDDSTFHLLPITFIKDAQNPRVSIYLQERES